MLKNLTCAYFRSKIRNVSDDFTSFSLSACGYASTNRMVDRHGQNCIASDIYGHQKYCELGTLPLKDSRCSFTTWAKNRSLQHPHAHGAMNVMRTWVGGQLRRMQRVQMLWAGKAGFGSLGLLKTQIQLRRIQPQFSDL